MSIRAGIAALNKRLEQIKDEAAGLVGLCERMRKLRAERVNNPGPGLPKTAAEARERLALLEPGGLAYKMTERRLHRLETEEANG